MLLEAGMIIYCHRTLPTYLEKLTITRVTAKQAVVDCGHYESRFDRDVRDGSCFSEKGDTSKWTKTRYRVATPELDTQYYRQQLEYHFSKVKADTLSISQLERILEITKEDSK